MQLHSSHGRAVSDMISIVEEICNSSCYNGTVDHNLFSVRRADKELYKGPFMDYLSMDRGFQAAGQPGCIKRVATLAE